MKWGWFFAEAIVWYLFINVLLVSIKYEVTIWYSSLILLILAYLGTYLCPWFRETAAYKRMVKAKKKRRKKRK
jgi:hypothetical protein